MRLLNRMAGALALGSALTGCSLGGLLVAAASHRRHW